MLLDRDFEHLAGRGAVDVAALGKDLLTPLFTGHPCDDACFNGRKVRDNELLAVSGNEGRPDQLRERVRHILIQHFDTVVVTGADKGTCLSQIREVVLRQVLQLDQPSCPASCAVGSIELEHATGTAIGADSRYHRLIFPDAGFGKLLPEHQDAL